jgi:hypothetical protein
MQKYAATLVLGSLLCASVQADAGDMRCFRSSGPAKPLRLEFGFPPEGAKDAYVRYEGGSANIRLKLLKSDSIETAPGRPMESTTRWKEDLPGGGTYTVVSQGARVYGLTYVRAKDHKAFAFEEDLEAWEQSGCRWRRR